MGNLGRSCLRLQLGFRTDQRASLHKSSSLDSKAQKSHTHVCSPSRTLRIWNPEGTSHSRRQDCESPQFKSEEGASFPSGFRGEAQKPRCYGKGSPCHIRSVAPDLSSRRTKGTLDPQLSPKATLSADAGSSTPMTLESTHASPDTASTSLT